MGGFAAWPLLLTLAAAPDRVAVEPAGPRPGGDLGAEDARYLDWLVDDFLFDPKHAAYVRAPVRGDPEWADLSRYRAVADEPDGRDGWLVRGTNGNPDRVYFADGESVAIPAARTRQLDFAAMCAARYGLRTGRRPTHQTREPDLILAAWLHRRGYDGLAVRALAAARDSDDDPRQALRADLARHAADACVRAFAERDDTPAMAHAARLFALYPEQARSAGQAADIAADITRRHHAGIGSRVPPTGTPNGFDRWPVHDRVAFLVRSLEEVDSATAHTFELDMYGRLTSDWRIMALVGLGDAAVPALIDAAERDHRLTRWREQIMMLCCRGGKGGRQPDRVFSVSEVARDLLRRILRVRVLDPTAGPGADEDDTPAADIARLRRYWARYGRLAFPDRMMATLTDPAARPDARRDAATCLVEAATVADSWSRRPGRPTGPSPLVARYAGPTVAEAVLAALDRELVARADERPGWQDRVEETYLQAVVNLGDVRIGSELARRANAAASTMSRLRLAKAAASLGLGGPLVAVCREVATGTVRFPLPPDREQAATAVRDLVYELIDCQTADADAALEAMAVPGHPYFPIVVRGVLGDPDDRVRGGAWTRHPFCLTVLRHLLADRRPTGGHAYRRGDEIEEIGRGKLKRWTPPGGANPAVWAEHIERTVADDAADRLAEQVAGLPECHPLRRNADRVRAVTRRSLAMYAGRFRPLTWPEKQRWDMWQLDVAYVPDLKPLGRPATAADVAAGRAVFHLGGAGKVADVALPAWLLLKNGGKAGDPPVWGLAVQAETGPDGVLTYGAIFRHAIRAVKATEVERVEVEPRD